MAPQRALHNRIWEHKSSTILFSSVQNNSTDRVRCHPWSALIFWNAKIKQHAWPPSTFPMDPTPFVFHHIPENYHSHPAELLDSFFFCQNGLERDSMWNYRRLRWELHLPQIPEYVIPGHFSKKKTKKTFHSPSTKILWSAQILPSPMIWQYVYLPSCGVWCPRWSAKNLWNAKNSEYAWLVYRDHIGKFRGQNHSNPKASPNFQGHTSGFYFSEFTLGEAPGKKLATFTQPTFKNVTSENPVLLR